MADNYKNTFGGRLRQALKSSKISQVGLAELLGRHKNTVSKWIRNERQPGISDLRLMSHYLEVDYNWLLTGETPVEYAARKIARKNSMKDVSADYSVKMGEVEIGALVEKIMGLSESNRALVLQLINKLAEGEKK